MRLGMQYVSHNMRALSKPPKTSALQSFTITAISRQAPQIFPSLAATAWLTQSASPAPDRIWPSHFSCCFSFVIKSPRIRGCLSSYLVTYCFFFLEPIMRHIDVSLLRVNPLCFIRVSIFLLAYLASFIPWTLFRTSSIHIRGARGTSPNSICIFPPGWRWSHDSIIQDSLADQGATNHALTIYCSNFSIFCQSCSSLNLNPGITIQFVHKTQRCWVSPLFQAGYDSIFNHLFVKKNWLHHSFAGLKLCLFSV